MVLMLLVSDAGGVARMDESYEYVDDCVAPNCADSPQKIRVTSNKDSAAGESDHNAEASRSRE
jgi:hypothetical protein